MTKKVIKVVDQTSKFNGATLIPELDLGVSFNADGTLTPFKLSTLEAQTPVKVTDELDAVHYEPVSKRLVVNTGEEKDGSSLVVLQVPSFKVIGTLKVPTKKPEGAASGGRGNFNLAARELNQVFRLDVKALRVTA